MGTSLLKNFNVEKEEYMTGGFKKLWKIHKGTPKTREGKASVFVFEKKRLDSYSSAEREEILSTLRKEAQTLQKYKHPGILSIQEPLIEDKSTLVFATEYVPYSLSDWADSDKSRLELKMVIIQLCEVLHFLHEDAKVIHSNLNPYGCFVDEKGRVKISCLTHSIGDPPVEGIEYKYNCNLSKSLPDLCWVAPEIVLEERAYFRSDVFSLGFILYYLSRRIKSSVDSALVSLSNNTPECYKKAMGDFERTKRDNLNKLEAQEDRNLIERTLERNPSSRPTISELMENKWFNDPLLKALKFIENLPNNEPNKNIEFLKIFPTILLQFEEKIIIKRILPVFISCLRMENLITQLLPSIIAIGENVKLDFEKEIWEGVKGLFQMKQMPAAALYFILTKLQFIGDRVSNSEFTSSMLNIICKALDCNVVKIQSVVLSNFPYIIKKIDSQAFKNQLYPRLADILTNTSSKSLKLTILKSVKECYNILDQSIINDSLLKTLEKVRKVDNSGDICMNVVAIYEEIAKIVTVEVKSFM